MHIDMTAGDETWNLVVENNLYKRPLGDGRWEVFMAAPMKEQFEGRYVGAMVNRKYMVNLADPAVNMDEAMAGLTLPEDYKVTELHRTWEVTF